MTDSIHLAAHLRALEESLLDPDVRRDLPQLESLLAADFLEFGSSGRIWTREAILDQLAREPSQQLEMEDFHCAQFSDNAALITWRSIRTDAQTGSRSASLRSSIWIKENGEWRVRFHQGTQAA